MRQGRRIERIRLESKKHPPIWIWVRRAEIFDTCAILYLKLDILVLQRLHIEPKEERGARIRHGVRLMAVSGARSSSAPFLTGEGRGGEVGTQAAISPFPLSFAINHLPNRRHGLHDLVRVILKPVQYGRFARIVEAQNQDPALLGAKHGRKRLDDLRDEKPPVEWICNVSTWIYPPTPPPYARLTALDHKKAKDMHATASSASWGVDTGTCMYPYRHLKGATRSWLCVCVRKRKRGGLTSLLS